MAATIQSGLVLSGRSDTSPSPSNLVDAPAASPSSGSLQTLQVTFWISDGGGDLGLDIANAWVKIISVFTKNSITPQQLTVPCATLTSTVPKANAYFTVPNSRDEQLWSQLLGAARTVAATCETYLKAPTTANLNKLGNMAISNQYDSLIAFLKWVDKQPLPVR